MTSWLAARSPSVSHEKPLSPRAPAPRGWRGWLAAGASGPHQAHVRPWSFWFTSNERIERKPPVWRGTLSPPCHLHPFVTDFLRETHHHWAISNLGGQPHPLRKWGLRWDKNGGLQISLPGDRTRGGRVSGRSPPAVRPGLPATPSAPCSELPGRAAQRGTWNYRINGGSEVSWEGTRMASCVLRRRSWP